MRRSRLRVLMSIALLTASSLAATPSPARAQQEERRAKVPVIGKITGGSNRQAFSGKVQSLDLKRNLLKVDTVEGGSTEYFPVKRTVTVTNAAGGRRRIEDLTPGVNVIVYYQVKEDRRNVTEIILLGAQGSDGTNKATPPS